MNRIGITINSISKSFMQNDSELNLLEDISLKVGPGESLGLVGASGSGKSTLLHIMSGLEKPDSGSVLINNIEITSLDADSKAKLRNDEIGFVYQFHHLLPDLNAIENIALPSMLAGLSREIALERAKLLLEQINLSGKEYSKPNELSGGERQRVAIARSMSNKPSCLIMDEPTGNLDSSNVQDFMDLLMEMVEKHKIALVIATHDNNVSGRLDNLLGLE